MINLSIQENYLMQYKKLFPKNSSLEARKEFENFLTKLTMEFGGQALFDFQIKNNFITHYGEYIYIENLGAIDTSIVKIILDLNHFGFITKYCCSGIRKEHSKPPHSGYVLFQQLSKDKEHVLISICNQLQIEFKRINDEIRIAIKGDDDLIYSVWEKFHKELLKTLH